MTKGQVVGAVKKFITIASSCALLLLAVLAVGIDDWAGESRNVIFEVVFVLLGIVFGVSAFAFGEHKAFLALPSIYILFILALPFLELSPVKPALRAGEEIRPGMSETQVRAVLDRHFPEHGHFKRPTIGVLENDLLFFVLDPNDGRYNAAVAIIRFSAGKCVSAEFHPD